MCDDNRQWSIPKIIRSSGNIDNAEFTPAQNRPRELTIGFCSGLPDSSSPKFPERTRVAPVGLPRTFNGWSTFTGESLSCITVATRRSLDTVKAAGIQRFRSPPLALAVCPKRDRQSSAREPTPQLGTPANRYSGQIEPLRGQLRSWSAHWPTHR